MTYDKFMIDLEHTLISQDVLTCHFACDLSVCKGACCVEGDSGAPLEEEEALLLDKLLPHITPFLRKEGVEAIQNAGASTIDSDHDIVTPLVQNRECAYTIFENGIAKCGIEKAWLAGAIAFRKPISCHLYPIRIRKYKNYDAVNYDQWDICMAARMLGQKNNIPVYKYTEEALIRKYGKEWFQQLSLISEKINNNPEF